MRVTLANTPLHCSFRRAISNDVSLSFNTRESGVVERGDNPYMELNSVHLHAVSMLDPTDNCLIKWIIPTKK